MTTHFTVLSSLSSSSRKAQIIGDCTLSFPIGTWAVAANHLGTLEMHLAEPPSLAKPTKVQPSYCGRRGADEQMEAPDIAFKSRHQPTNGWQMVVMPRWLSWDGRVVGSQTAFSTWTSRGR
jgi:hypothetical protein